MNDFLKKYVVRKLDACRTRNYLSDSAGSSVDIDITFLDIQSGVCNET